MRYAIIAALVLPLAPAAAQAPRGVAKAAKPCVPANGIVDYKSTPSIGPRKLGEMPPAVEIKALYRVVDGCPKPIVVRRGLGAPAESPAPASDGAPQARPLR